MDTTYTRGKRCCRKVLVKVVVDGSDQRLCHGAVEPVDSWRPDAHVYESGEILRSPVLGRLSSLGWERIRANIQSTEKLVKLSSP